jgi:general secretion pathway protein D
MILEEASRGLAVAGRPAVGGPDVPTEKAAGAVAAPDHHATRPQTRRQMLEEVDLSWLRPQISERGEPTDTREEEDVMRLRLRNVHLPRLEFRELALSRVVEVLAEMTEAQTGEGQGINIVLLDPSGSDPLVSIILRQISLERALDFIVESVGFAYELQRDAVVLRPHVGAGRGLETAFYPLGRSTLIRLTGSASVATEEPPAQAFEDPFAPRADPAVVADERGAAEARLKAFLQRAGVAFDAIEGADLALADGQLIVTQTPRNHEKIRRLLQRYREIKQVEIEARFMEVQERNLEELGFEWSLVGAKGRFGNAPARNLANAFSVGGDESAIVIDRGEAGTPEVRQGAPVLPITVDLAQAAEPLAVLGTVMDGLQVQGMLRALERQSGNDLLSAPKLTVLSGKTAEIVVAEEFRYPESYGDMNAEVGRGDSSSGSAGVAITAGTPQSFTTRNVGVEMEVTATVEEDNAISLRLRPKVTEFEGFVEYGGTSIAIASDTTVTVPSGFYQPIFSVRRIDTEVTIWDGATVIMGGLTREHSVRIDDRVPLLGSIPLLGRLFRNEGESTQKRNLLIFVTANLVSPGGSPAFQYLPEVEPNSLFQQPNWTSPQGVRRRSGK